MASAQPVSTALLELQNQLVPLQQEFGSLGFSTRIVQPGNNPKCSPKLQICLGSGQFDAYFSVGEVGANFGCSIHDHTTHGLATGAWSLVASSQQIVSGCRTLMERKQAAPADVFICGTVRDTIETATT
jgi:hypothetical protein